MSLIHLIFGENAAKNLQEAISMDETMQGEIITLKDNLAFGSIYTPEGKSFTQVRNEYNNINLEENIDYTSDEQKIENILNNKTEETQVWFWMAPNVSDTIAYFWLLPYFQNQNGLLSVININALPFFNEKGQLYYPTNFSQILPKEIIKCKRLAKEVSTADYEVDVDEWKRIASENAQVRAYEGNKKIVSKNESNFDILIYTACTTELQKAQKVINNIVNKNSHIVTEAFITSRVKKLIEIGKLDFVGDTSKTLKDFEIRRIKESNDVNETTLA